MNQGRRLGGESHRPTRQSGDAGRGLIRLGAYLPLVVFNVSRVKDEAKEEAEQMIKAMKYLLERGAAVNLQDKWRMTALHYVAHSETYKAHASCQLAVELVKNGADP